MGVLTTFKKYVLLSLQNRIILFNLSSGKKFESQIKDTSNLKTESTEEKIEQKSEIPKEVFATSAAFSKDGSLFVLTTNRKQMFLYNLYLVALKKWELHRAASKVIFSTDKILVADKTGDVYQYEFDSANNEIILGHLSMLLDIKLTDDEKYIVTCDRDEKIRVSHFPNSYNIVNFCLGHKEFITCIELLNDILISSSGDGTIKFWDFILGTQLYNIDCHKNVSDNNILTNFTNYMDTENVEIFALPVTNMTLNKNDNCTHLAVSLYKTNSIQFYNIKVCNKDNIQVDFIQNLEIPGNIVSLMYNKNILYVLSDNGINCYSYNTNTCFYTLFNISLLNDYSVCNSVSFKNVQLPDIPLLYKRKYDNVQEYQERKKLRVENKSKF